MSVAVWVAVALGISEGITEYLPVSSTGHLILATHAFGATGANMDTFIIFIQAGSILGVCWHYRVRLAEAIAGVFARSRREWRFAMLIAVATLPAVACGIAFHSVIKEHLLRPATVAAALIAGGIAIIIIERKALDSRTDSINSMGYRQALFIGIAQVLALFPGVSRAAATIMGGRMAGLTRRCATEFSFFLAIPVVMGASGFDLAKNIDVLAAGDIPFFAIGFATAFVVTLLTVRLLLAYVARYSDQPVGWYRIALGLVVLLVLARPA